MAIMPPHVCNTMLKNNYEAGQHSGSESKLTEVICRLLASEMSEDEISVTLCNKPDVVSDVLKYKSEVITLYAKQLKGRRKRRERKANS